jgi:hypothetical protein
MNPAHKGVVRLQNLHSGAGILSLIEIVKLTAAERLDKIAVE